LQLDILETFVLKIQNVLMVKMEFFGILLANADHISTHTITTITIETRVNVFFKKGIEKELTLMLNIHTFH
jgi:hypothetical protein